MYRHIYIYIWIDLHAESTLQSVFLAETGGSTFFYTNEIYPWQVREPSRFHWFLGFRICAPLHIYLLDVMCMHVCMHACMY